MAKNNVSNFLITIILGILLNSAHALELPEKYVVHEIQPHKDKGFNTIFLRNYPSIMSVEQSNEKVWQCLRASMTENIPVALEIDEQQKIINCKR